MGREGGLLSMLMLIWMEEVGWMLAVLPLSALLEVLVAGGRLARMVDDVSCSFPMLSLRR